MTGFEKAKLGVIIGDQLASEENRTIRNYDTSDVYQMMDYIVSTAIDETEKFLLQKYHLESKEATPWEKDSGY